MKKILLTLAVVCTAFIFASCGDNNEENGENNGGNNNGGGSAITTITGKLKLIEETWVSGKDTYEYTILGDVTDEVDEIGLFIEIGDEDDYEEILLGKGRVSEGQFSFKLPTPPSQYLIWNIGAEVPTGITVSDKTAKSTGEIWLSGFKNNEEVGDIEKIPASLKDDVFVMLMYVDKDVRITGSYRDEDDGDMYIEEYDMSLKKGWNVMVSTETVSGNTYTSKNTANNEPANMIWGLELDGENVPNRRGEATDSSEKISTSKSLFKSFRKK